MIQVENTILPNKPLNNFEILDAVKKIDLINFRGVFLRNPLPKKPKRHECGIMNLDDSSGNGTHWVAWFKRGNDKWYLDSFGFPPNIFLHSGFLSNLRLPWKTELPWNFSLYWNIIYHSGFLNNLRLPCKTKCALEFFTVFKYFVPFWIFEQLALALKTEFALKFFKPGGQPPSPTTRSVRLCIRFLTLGTLWDVLRVNAIEEL